MLSTTIQGTRLIPSLLLSNVNHVLNKLDELFLLVSEYSFDIIAITESWLTEHVPDSLVTLRNYTLFRRDRTSGAGGGIMCYIRNDITAHFLDLADANANDFEIIWLSLRPSYLPRPLSCIILAILYCPPWYSVPVCKELSKYIVSCVDKLSRKYPDPCFLITGDFNSLDCNLLNKYLHFKQLVQHSTRGDNILDKIFTNHCEFFCVPIILPPLGRSDHFCVFLNSLSQNRPPVGRRTIYHRNLSVPILNDIGKDLVQVNWSEMYLQDDCQLQADYFYSVVHAVIDNHAPVEKCVLKNNDKPWITPKFISFVKQRNTAFMSGNRALYKRLRNTVNRLRLKLQRQYYRKHVDSLKSDNPRMWWKSVKNICGIDSKTQTAFKGLTHQGEFVSEFDMQDVINNFFVGVGDDIEPLDKAALIELRSQLQDCPNRYIVSELAVYCALNRLKISKSTGPDMLDNRLLKYLADVLAAPVCSLINSSIRQGVVPSQWKLSRVTPIPKCSPVRNIENDFRPISITPSLAKIAESFVSSFFDEHFRHLVDINQFGCTRNRSTTFALIKFSHDLFVASDNCHNFLRILFIDFAKAFDRIDHNVLLQKFIDYHFPPHVTVWSMSFLDEREQFVRIDDRCSSTAKLKCGSPQGTLSGPNDFKLLINDLIFTLSYIKYVDDTSVASVSTDSSDTSLQNALHDLVVWCSRNSMRINTSKTKEIVVHFGKRAEKSQLAPLTVNNAEIEQVDCFKLLGVYFNSDLTWKHHVEYLLKKTAKRIYFIYLLVKAGVSSPDVVLVYCSIIRSVLEYASPVWHAGLTKTQSDDIEGVQRRCLRIIYPELSYNEALFVTGLERLNVRRENSVQDIFNEIKKPDNVLNYLLPRRLNTVKQTSLRQVYPYLLQRAKTSRFNKSFISYCIKKRY